MKDVFEEGYVDKAIFQSTYLKYWYTDGFNTIEQNGALLEKHPDKFIVNGRWDPRDGDAGLKQLEEDAERWNLKGVKLYTAEWHENGSRGWKLTDPESYRFLEKCQELGIKNIHAHKGPTIWPLNKDAFSVDDVDAGRHRLPGPELHHRARRHPADRRLRLHGGAGAQRLRRAARWSSAALMHARPKFFAKVHRRAAVLGRRGPADLRQRLQHLDAEVAGRGLRRLADARRRGVHRLPEAHHRDEEEDPRPQRGQALRHRGAGGVPAPDDGGRARSSRASSSSRTARGRRRDVRGPPGDDLRRRRLGRAGDGARPGARRADHGSRLRGVLHRLRRRRRGRRLRLPTFFCAPNFSFLMVADAYDAVSAVAGGDARGDRAGRPPRLRGDQRRGGRAGAASSRRSRARPTAELDELRGQFLEKAVVAGQDRVARPLVDAGVGPDELAELTLGAVAGVAGPRPAARAAGGARAAARRRRAAAHPRRRQPGHVRRRCRCTCGGRVLTRHRDRGERGVLQEPAQEQVRLSGNGALRRLRGPGSPFCEPGLTGARARPGRRGRPAHGGVTSIGFADRP